VDTGATHNFMATATATLLGLTVTKALSSALTIQVASPHTLGTCRNVTLVMAALSEDGTARSILMDFELLIIDYDAAPIVRTLTFTAPNPVVCATTLATVSERVAVTGAMKL
jgi:hypothetical protein